MSKVKDGSYIHIQSWMVNELGLKGNDLLLYALIYGFCQSVENQCFEGSLQYLADWTNGTRQGVIKNIDNLINKGLVIKYIGLPTNKYVAIRPTAVKKEEVKEEPNSYLQSKEIDENVTQIIHYMNSVCGTAFKSSSEPTTKAIKKRLKEGFTLEDFKKVIDLKYHDWGMKPFRFKNGQLSSENLRPTTLFGDKFEGYVYEAITREQSEGSYSDSVSADVDPDVSGKFF